MNGYKKCRQAMREVELSVGVGSSGGLGMLQVPFNLSPEQAAIPDKRVRVCALLNLAGAQVGWPSPTS